MGFGIALLPGVERALPPGRLIIVDDPDVIAARGLREKVDAYPCIAELVEAPIQDEAAALEIMGALALPDELGAIIPGQEYGVVGAAALAHLRGMPGAGLEAARNLRDKTRLRRAAARRAVAQPAWQEVTGPDDIRAFGRAEFVLKPANRQASVGVQLLGAGDDVDAAWQRTVDADEPLMRAPRGFRPRYLVEERLHGPELSIEAIVRAGEVVFANITAKSVLPGRHPVELGHVMPAPLPAEVAERLETSLRAFVAAVGFGYGTLHSEWILVDGVPHLVECAGRLPGDELIPLLDLAYGGNIVGDLITVCSGTDPGRPARAARGAAVHFLTASPGLVTRVGGADAARAVAGVVDVRVTAAPGARVGQLLSSWDRLGRIIATGDTAEAAAGNAAAAVAAVGIDTVEPVLVAEPDRAAHWWPGRPADPRASLAWAAGTSEPVRFLGLPDGPALWLRDTLSPAPRMNAADVASGAVAGLEVDPAQLEALRAAYPRQLVCAATGYGSPVVAAAEPTAAQLSTLVAGLVAEAGRQQAVPALLHVPQGDPLLDVLEQEGFAVGMADLYPVLDLPGDGIDDYLAMLSKGRRSNARRETAARAGGRVDVFTGEQCRPHLAAAAWLNAQGYLQRGGYRDEHEALAVYQRLVDRCGDDFILTMVSVGDQPVASATLIAGTGELLLYSAGLLLPDSRDVAGYFNAAYYLPIEYAYAHGMRRIHLGPTGWQAKQLRGARFTPLYAAVPATETALVDLLKATDVGLRAELAALGG
ncbi:GNAT family N-acetyltransferase [Catellatospora sp. TT07R-123]|uniref:GNAT family N-acetyltransferase n=1 Tax=Catellatospora sp. TT07R-123 TaxID=2733863 RepID=UPI001FCF9E4A|nr:GNAT family N-acetyltransferase [Catellatospora sp. TT07R-123]